MADSTTRPETSGGDAWRSDDVGGGEKLQVMKINTGRAGVDGGLASAASPIHIVAEHGWEAIAEKMATMNELLKARADRRRVRGGAASPPFVLQTVGGGAILTPESLPLEGYWRASYVPKTWFGTASLGGSLGRDVTEPVSNPTAGTAVNGWVPSRWDGSRFTTSTALGSDFYTASQYSGFALVNVTAPATSQAFNFNGLNAAILTGNTTVQYGIAMRQNAGHTIAVWHKNVSSVIQFASMTYVPDTWMLVQWRLLAGVLSIRINGGAWTDQAGVTNALSLTQPVTMGRNSDNTQQTTFSALEIGMSKAALTDAQFNTVRDYSFARYALTV